MAEKEIPFYNIRQSVGPGRANSRTDVMLVQFFLQQIFDHPNAVKDKPVGAKMEINGTYDEIVGAWIKQYQVSSRLPLVADGRVDRAPQQVAKTPRAHRFYTITMMNYEYRAYYPAAHDHLEKHPSIPSLLQAELVRDDVPPGWTGRK